MEKIKEYYKIKYAHSGRPKSTVYAAAKNSNEAMLICFLLAYNNLANLESFNLISIEKYDEEKPIIELRSRSLPWAIDTVYSYLDLKRKFYEIDLKRRIYESV